MAKQEGLTSWRKEPHNSDNQSRQSQNFFSQGVRQIPQGMRKAGKRRPHWMRECMEALLKVQDADCPRCDIEAKLRHRPFSEQALSALIVWGEIQEAAVGVPLCDNCYEELRDILIERQEEISNPQPPERTEIRKPAKPSPAVATAAAKKVTAKKTEKVKEKEKPAAKTGKKTVKRAS